MWFSADSIALTLEVHDDKDPEGALRHRLPYLYLETRDPLLSFVASAHHAVKVSNICTAAPVADGRRRASAVLSTAC